MLPQTYDWTCSICSFTWVINATGTAELSRQEAGMLIGYPECVNETYGCMSSQCIVDAFAGFSLSARAVYATFDQAYAICQKTTGVINPHGMYHFMAIRGVDGFDLGELWVANSAPGYRGVGDYLSRSQFNSLGPVELVYLEQPQP